MLTYQNQNILMSNFGISELSDLPMLINKDNLIHIHGIFIIF